MPLAGNFNKYISTSSPKVFARTALLIDHRTGLFVSLTKALYGDVNKYDVLYSQTPLDVKNEENRNSKRCTQALDYLLLFLSCVLRTGRVCVLSV